MSINYACSLCVENPLLRDIDIEIVSDSLMAVTWINSDHVGSLAHVNLVYGIWDHLRSHAALSVRFSSRASNSYANSLAKKGSNNKGDIIHWGSIIIVFLAIFFLCSLIDGCSYYFWWCSSCC